MLTPKEIDLVKESWQSVVPIADTAASLFYGRLFELDPSLKELFKSDMQEQGKKLMQMIGVAVSNLHQLDQVLEPVQDLGRRHTDYKVAPEHYDTVGAALLWTLAQGLGDAFTPEVETAWTKTYTALATIMKDAAQSAAA